MLHKKGKVVYAEYLEKRPFEVWESLQLIEARVVFVQDKEKDYKFRAVFEDRGGNELNLPVTDAYFKGNGLEADKEYSCCLTMSLGVPLNHEKYEKMLCYKIVAGVFFSVDWFKTGLEEKGSLIDWATP